MQCMQYWNSTSKAPAEITLRFCLALLTPLACKTDTSALLLARKLTVLQIGATWHTLKFQGYDLAAQAIA